MWDAIPGTPELAVVLAIALLLFGFAYTIYNFFRAYAGNTQK